MNTIETILYLAQQAGTPLCLNPDDGKFYLYREGGEGLARLSPIREPSQTFATFEPSRLVTLGNLTALQRIENGSTTDWQRIANGIETDAERLDNGQETALQRTRNGITTALNRDVIGEGKVNLARFSISCPAEVMELAQKVEELLDRAIKNTNKPATIDNLIKLHRNAATFATDGNIYKLKQVEQRLRGIIAKQSAMKASEATMGRRERRRLLCFKIAACLVVVASLGFWGWWRFSRSPAQATHDPGTIATAARSPTPPEEASPLLAAFEEYEAETGNKLWPGGRACIERAAIAAGVINDKDKIKRLIYKSTQK